MPAARPPSPPGKICPASPPGRIDRCAPAVVFSLSHGVALAAGIPTLAEVEVKAGSSELLGIAASATEGTVSAGQLQTRPLLRPAEVVETVPGVIVTQHSGDGKANQYFLRGFNLDHGTDFSMSVAGVPVNMPSHAHGQGYADLNFLIPELVARMQYRKGPYHATEGDFSAAGAAHIDYIDRLDAPTAEIGIGQYGYRRGFAANSWQAGAGNLLLAGELASNDGPWQMPEKLRKRNAVLRYSQGGSNNGWSLTGMAYAADWDATDQIPRRAVDAGRIDRFGTVDTSDGGQAQRYSLSGDWRAQDDRGRSRASFWWLENRLNLWSNFSYFLDFPDDGDQFEQAERRRAFGGELAHSWFGTVGGHNSEFTLGGQLRQDRIGPLGLYRTVDRQRQQKTAADGSNVPATVREDRVGQRSVGLYAEHSLEWNRWLRSVTGLRGDFYHFDVRAGLTGNGGKASDHLWQPKLTLIAGPFRQTEFYLNWGEGFHSNDARGATIRVDPNDGMTPQDKVDPLVKARGSEFGLRSAPFAGLQTTLALWRLDIDSELVFVGDAGVTEASRPSRRSGVEGTAYWTPVRGVTLDADLSWSRARFRDDDPAGSRIPGAMERVASLGLGIDDNGPWFGGLRLRHFGVRPLIEDNSVRAPSSTLTNLRLGYRPAKQVQLTLDVLNLFDRKVSDIDYWYASQLRGEAAPVDDIHTHPAEPRSARLSVALKF